MKSHLSKLLLLTGLSMLFGITSSNVLGKPSPQVEEKPDLEEQQLSTKLFEQLLIAGTSVAPIPKDPILSAPTKQADWGKIAVSNEGEPLLFAVGTAITAGYREGGLFRQGQLTAYPNLIAHQMGLKKFNSGAFPLESGNGTGYLELVNSKGIPEYKLVNNNLAKKQTDPVRYEKADQAVSNFGLPFLDYQSAGAFPAYTAEQLNPNGYDERETMRYFMRYLPQNSEGSRENPIKMVKEHPQSDLGFVEFGFTDYLGFYQTAGRITDYGFYMNGHYPNLDFIESMGKNAIVMTVPEVRDLPYFHFVEAKDLLTQGEVTHSNSWNWEIEKLRNNDIILPTKNVLDFLSKPYFPIQLNPEDVLSESERGFGIENYNKLI